MFELRIQGMVPAIMSLFGGRKQQNEPGVGDLNNKERRALLENLARQMVSPNPPNYAHVKVSDRRNHDGLPFVTALIIQIPGEGAGPGGVKLEVDVMIAWDSKDRTFVRASLTDLHRGLDRVWGQGTIHGFYAFNVKQRFVSKGHSFQVTGVSISMRSLVMANPDKSESFKSHLLESFWTEIDVKGSELKHENYVPIKDDEDDISNLTLPPPGDGTPVIDEDLKDDDPPRAATG